MSDVLSSILGSMEKPPGIPDKDRQKSKGMCYMSSQKVYVICRHKRSMFSVRKAMGTMTVSKSLHFRISAQCLSTVGCKQPLRTVAIGNLERQVTIEIMRHDHSIIACSRHIYMGVVLRAHSVRGESHIQRSANGEVATAAFKF